MDEALSECVLICVQSCQEFLYLRPKGMSVPSQGGLRGMAKPPLLQVWILRMIDLSFQPVFAETVNHNPHLSDD